MLYIKSYYSSNFLLNMLHRIALSLLLLSFSFVSCKKETPIIFSSGKSILASNAAVVSAHPLASEVGIKILSEGGNAIDAAIAVQFALAVTYPVAGNIGGGGFMIVRMSDGELHALDFRETAPSNATRNMYLDEDGEVIKDASLQGHLAVGTPGTVDGMYKAFNKLSKLKDWKALVTPSVKLAQEGFEITAKQAKRLNKYKNKFDEVNSHRTPFSNSLDWNESDLLIQPDLAKVLMAIADNGRTGFYEGWVADTLVNEMVNNGGLINHEDLKNYESKWRSPILSNYRGHQIIGMPPASSGGIALTQLLGSVEPYNVGDMGFQSAEHMHLVVEAERRVYADRSKHLGDSDFYDVPIDVLKTDKYNSDRMLDFDPEKASLSSDISWGTIKESEQTTHFSIVDQFGNAVSLTTTINTAYGSKVVVKGGGYFLNNEMDDFSAKPGVPNYFELVGNDANAIEAGKRMLSSMTPTIVTKDGQLKIVVGTPGGSTIITSIFQVIMNIIDFGMDANEATQACRFHHQWLPDEIKIEKECFDQDLLNQLRAKGHKIKERGDIGKVETIRITEDGMLDAAGDRRGDDTAYGF